MPKEFPINGTLTSNSGILRTPTQNYVRFEPIQCPCALSSGSLRTPQMTCAQRSLLSPGQGRVRSPFGRSETPGQTTESAASRSRRNGKSRSELARITEGGVPARLPARNSPIRRGFIRQATKRKHPLPKEGVFLTVTPAGFEPALPP